MAWRARLGFAGWIAFGCYVWLTHPILMATLLLWGLVAAMLTLAVLSIARGAKRITRAKWQETKTPPIARRGPVQLTRNSMPSRYARGQETSRR